MEELTAACEGAVAVIRSVMGVLQIAKRLINWRLACYESGDARCGRQIPKQMQSM